MITKKHTLETALILSKLLRQIEIEFNAEMPYGEYLPHETPNLIQSTVDAFCALYGADNRHFDREKFIRAIYGTNITDITDPILRQKSLTGTDSHD